MLGVGGVSVSVGERGESGCGCGCECGRECVEYRSVGSMERSMMWKLCLFLFFF